MKLRIKDNTLRFRLTQSEVQALFEKGRVSASINFASGTLTYSIESKPTVRIIVVDFMNSDIVIHVPQDIIGQWASTEQVGIRTDVKAGLNKTLNLLIEKDFSCLQPRLGENETDLFPNPLAKEQS